MGIGVGDIKFSDEFGEPIWHSLPHDVVVHGAELVSDPRLNFGVQAALLARCRISAGLRLYIFHDLFHAHRELSPCISKTYALLGGSVYRAPSGGLIRSKPESSQDPGTFIGVGSSQAHRG